MSIDGQGTADAWPTAVQVQSRLRGFSVSVLHPMHAQSYGLLRSVAQCCELRQQQTSMLSILHCKMQTVAKDAPFPARHVETTLTMQ